ncbi:hypothetical protein ACFE04_014721 [Oxalis oulophora]
MYEKDNSLWIKYMNDDRWNSTFYIIAYLWLSVDVTVKTNLLLAKLREENAMTLRKKERKRVLGKEEVAVHQNNCPQLVDRARDAPSLKKKSGLSPQCGLELIYFNSSLTTRSSFAVKDIS